MTWAALLLADPSPCLRRLALRELLRRPNDDAEVRELDALVPTDPLIADLVDRQAPDGSWEPRTLGATGTVLQATSLALLRLGYLGLGPQHGAVSRGAEFLFSQQRPDGAWPLPAGRDESDEREGYSEISLQTSLPLRGLAACGYARDPRAERAYEWLVARRLEDGAWPTGIAAGGVFGRVGGYRRLAHSRWGCRSNTTGALACLALHPERHAGPEMRRGLDLLLGRETREVRAIGYDLARTLGAEGARGTLTYYARFDLAQVLDLAWRAGAGTHDARVADLVAFVEGLRGAHGLWEHASRPQVSRWLTFELLRSLSRLSPSGDWVSLEPRTPFAPYPRRHRRY